jgi:hypothetical protein
MTTTVKVVIIVTGLWFWFTLAALILHNLSLINFNFTLINSSFSYMMGVVKTIHLQHIAMEQYLIALLW